MSYVYDVGARALDDIEAGIASDEVKTRFRLLFEEMHDANHRLDDGINRDQIVRRRAAMLERALTAPRKTEGEIAQDLNP